MLGKLMAFPWNVGGFHEMLGDFRCFCWIEDDFSRLDMARSILLQDITETSAFLWFSLWECPQSRLSGIRKANLNGVSSSSDQDFSDTATIMQVYWMVNHDVYC
jgi:hypothetical protein